MNPTIHNGMHPDAESLTAFAEQLLPAAEREEILAHMSTCGRCREVVFLVQQAATEEEPASVAPAAQSFREARSSWFNWKWAWIPAAACAGLITVAVLRHSQKEATQTQTATNTRPADSLQTPQHPAETQKPAVQSERKDAEAAKSSRVVAQRESAPQTVARDQDKRLDAKKPADEKDLASGSAARPALAEPGVAGGSIHGTMEARAKTAQNGGPSAMNQIQQQAPSNQQNMLQQSSAAQLDRANKPVNARPPTASETVTVQSQPVIPVQAVDANAPPVQLEVTPTDEQKEEASTADLAGVRKKRKVSLPGGLDALSEASFADRTIVLDTKGNLFLSEDSGKHWKPVRTQWTGRAVLVRSSNATEKGNALGALKALPMEKFELVTDDLRTWVSVDGTTWAVKPIPVN